MKILFSITLYLILSLNIFSQNIQVLEEFIEYTPYTKPSEFYYLEDQLDSLKSMKIATLKGTFRLSSKSSLLNLFAALKELANDYGANSFRIDSKKINFNKLTSRIIVSIYATSGTYLEENSDLHPKNEVYIFGSQKFYEDKLEKVKINKETVYLGSFEYIDYQNIEGKTVKINKGGITGSKIKITGSKNQKSLFYTFTDASIKPDYYSFYFTGNSIGGGVKIIKGKFVQINQNYGYFLTKILLLTKNIRHLADSTKNEDNNTK